MTIYDRVIPNDAVESLVALTLGMVLVLVFDFLLKMLRSHVIDVAGQTADERIGRRVFGHVLRSILSRKSKTSTSTMPSVSATSDSTASFGMTRS